jgi:hypothetical protein
LRDNIGMETGRTQAANPMVRSGLPAVVRPPAVVPAAAVATRRHPPRGDALPRHDRPTPLAARGRLVDIVV